MRGNELPERARRTLEAKIGALADGEMSRRLREWMAGRVDAEVVRPGREPGARRGFLFKLALFSGLMLLFALGLYVYGRVAGPKELAGLAIVPLAIGLAPIAVMLPVGMIVLPLRWIQGFVERVTPFWYYADAELFAIFDEPARPLTIFRIADLQGVSWIAEKAPGPRDFHLGVVGKDGTTHKHHRILFVRVDETLAFFDRLKARLGS